MLDVIRNTARRGARRIATSLDKLSGGRIHPDSITYFGLVMHLPIAWLIAAQHNIWAAIALVFFGLFDILDGAMATVKGITSARGMMLDASTDRMKEVMLYSGAAYALALSSHPTTAAWAVAACGASLCVSYVKAKGEAAVAAATTEGKNLSPTELNRLFATGLLSFEVRMALLVVGLLIDQLVVVVAAIAILASITAVQRLVIISKRLK